MEDRVREFYAAFARRDGAAMAAMYHPDAHFRDPAFGSLSGADAGRMWRMLTARGEDLTVSLEDVGPGGSSAHWIARYTFTQTGRKVVNSVHARFEWRDGLIAEHEDSFSFWKWSRQALGVPGLVLGWTPVLQAQVRKKALAQLASFDRS